MTLREFVEQEISCGRISCIEDFGESLDKLESSDGEELDKYTYQDYLESDIERAGIKIYYSHLSVSGVAWYEIELAEEEGKIE